LDSYTLIEAFKILH